MSGGFSISLQGVDEQVKRMMAMPGVFAKARKSAMSSTGYLIMGRLRSYIEGGGQGWQPLRDITTRLRKTAKKKTPLFWLSRFARYRISGDANSLQIGLGKSRKGQAYDKHLDPSRFDPWLDPTTERHEAGQTVRVGDKAQPHVAAQLSKGRANRKARTFIFKKSTTQVVIPKRPIFDPLFRDVAPLVPAHFEKEFLGSLARNLAKGAK